jgi:SAM-dependent methyltransferase
MIVTTGKASLQKVHSILSNRFANKSVRIYEAGGGSSSCLPSGLLQNAQVTAVDIDAGQLQRNRYAETKILGDIQTQEFSSSTFDLVVCYNVVEHLNAPDRAIELFYQSLTPGGLLFIAAPNPQSFSGWVTRATPHWLHVQYYRHVLRYRDAGQPGKTPFPTVFDRILWLPSLIDFCHSLGFNVIYCCEYRGMIYENMAERRPLLGKFLNLTVQALNAVTLWRKDLRNGDYHIVLEKPPRIENAWPEHVGALVPAAASGDHVER